MSSRPEVEAPAPSAAIANAPVAVKTLTYVISLPRDEERRRAFARGAEGADVTWAFFDALTEIAPGLVYDTDRSIIGCKRILTKTELGCYSSHWSLWDKLLKSDADQMLIMEDDVLVDWEFMKVVTRTDLASQGINYLKLFSITTCPFKHIKWHYLDKSKRLVRYVDYAFGAQAYILTRRAAEILVEHCRSIERPIDREMDRAWVHGVPNLAIYPYPVLEVSSPSRIGGSRYVAPPIPRRLLARRLVHKVHDAAQRVLNRFTPNPVLDLAGSVYE